jgi:hypothetical protein
MHARLVDVLLEQAIDARQPLGGDRLIGRGDRGRQEQRCEERDLPHLWLLRPL